jgi:hypothetical protein
LPLEQNGVYDLSVLPQHLSLYKAGAGPSLLSLGLCSTSCSCIRHSSRNTVRQICVWLISTFYIVSPVSKLFFHVGLYFQGAIQLFSKENPAGEVTSSYLYMTVLVLMIVCGTLASLKRFFIGAYLGKRTYVRYADELAVILAKLVLIGQVGNLARDKESLGIDFEAFELAAKQQYTSDDEDCSDGVSRDRSISPKHRKSRNLSRMFEAANLSRLQKFKIKELLGEWEEPAMNVHEAESNVPLSAVVQFRRSLSLALNTDYPFGIALGPATNRNECISSSEKVFQRLVGEETSLKFDVLALLAVTETGEIDREKVRSLIKLFRPSREGMLSLLDFAKSIDTTYRQLRLLRANVLNSA